MNATKTPLLLLYSEALAPVLTPHELLRGRDCEHTMQCDGERHESELGPLKVRMP